MTALSTGYLRQARAAGSRKVTEEKIGSVRLQSNRAPADAGGVAETLKP